MDLAPGTIVVWSDLGCPWAHCAVSRLLRTRAELGLDHRVRLDHRAFPLELFNERPTPKLVLDAEIPVVGAIEPDAGWQLWQQPDHEYPVTMLLALEAVQAAKEQSLEASEHLDRALRRAFFERSRCISLWSEVVAAAASCPAVDVETLRKSLEDGRGRRAVLDQLDQARRDDVQGSPHLFLPDGTDAHNPGVQVHWEGPHGEGFPVVDGDDPSVYCDLLQRAAAA
ncbi:MAG TPA: DsbA family protein [Acidimicrobiales bacterium]